MSEGKALTWESWQISVQRRTEAFLAWRKKRRLKRKERQKKRNVIVDWLDAILSAVVIVLLINQYLLQAYQIPSPSMVPTLMGYADQPQRNDRIFVNKIVFGPELIPGMLKLPGFRQPARGDVIIFESPEYLSSGPLVEVLQRIIYMVTLSFWDIDKDENGQPKHHFLIKRAIGMPGDRIRMNEGNVEILAPGAARWMPEDEMKKALGFTYTNIRQFQPENYPVFRAAGIGKALLDEGLAATPEEQKAIDQYYLTTTDASGRVAFALKELDDDIYVTQWESAVSWAVEPDNYATAARWRQLTEGYNVPEGRLFPMGDNRDNSHDARYFGPVRLEKVLGKALFRYWPLGRFGGIN
jgi:signal peptidase I